MSAIRRTLCCLWALLVVAAPAWAVPLSADHVPEPLRAWVPWVLHDEPRRDCVIAFDSAENRRCVWPGPLALDLGVEGGTFAQHWQVFAHGWVTLPGDGKQWPMDVTLDDAAVAVVERQGRPSVYLPPGQHALRGRFAWMALPQTLTLPSETALLEGGGEFPIVDEHGRLWLGKSADTGGEVQGEGLELDVFRRVVDDVPMQVIVHLDLRVSGKPREVVLPQALPAETVPVQLVSPLPARIEADGALRLQVRPGRWAVELTLRYPGEQTQVSLAPAPPPWPNAEVWVFDAQRSLRLVEVLNTTSIDPRQTTLPSAWQSLPAYRLHAGESLQLKVIRRGDPEPEPDRLQLERTLWLDFDGQGFTVRDQIEGLMTRGWRLQAATALQLGQVSLDGAPQLITTLSGGGQAGVEVRRGQVHLVAESRLEGNIEHPPVVGWEHEFRDVKATLNLPPGWKLWYVSGVDSVPNTWLQRWTLLDLFLVLIIAAAVGRLWGVPAALLALVTAGLTWHEPGAPRYVWLHILAAVALLRVLPAGRFQQLLRFYRGLALLALVLIAVPFAVEQVRLGLYPQLERPGQMIGPRADLAMAPEMQFDSVEAYAERGVSMARKALGGVAESGLKMPPPASLEQLDGNAKLQTGPGLPQWQWTSVPLVWSGPVPAEQTLNLRFISPQQNLLLNLCRVALLVALALWVAGWRLPRRAIAAPAAMILLGLLLVPVHDARAELPGNALLGELKKRLLEPPPCLPHCAEAARAAVVVLPQSLELRVELHVAQASAVPVPGPVAGWRPQQVYVDGEPASVAARGDKGELWLSLAAGVHEVRLVAPLAPQAALTLAFPLLPHRVTVQAQGWTVEGVADDGSVQGPLRFNRLREGEAQSLPPLEPAALPPFLRVERNLRLGLTWAVDTRVRRLSPTDAPLLVEIPLLTGEAVLSEAVRVVGERVQLNMAPGQQTAQWTSTLPITGEFVLTAAQDAAIAEVWTVEVGTLWHVSIDGIPVVQHGDESGRWLPQWRPWPGERVTVRALRPQGVPGETLTIDRSDLTLRPGRNASDAVLALTLRSSQGGQHALTLPPGAELLAVVIDDQVQPIRQEGQRVVLPLRPGEQQVRLDWRSSEGVFVRSPPVDLGTPSVNHRTHVELSRDRWVLFATGPQLGPAVLFWGALVVVALLAVGLGRWRHTPLAVHHWFLLGVGLTQSSLLGSLLIVGWLLALGARAQLSDDSRRWVFNLTQIGLAVLTLLALAALVEAVRHGLLGLPDMQVAGNGSSAYQLHWYQDQAGALLPQVQVFSVPLFVYRGLMLLWALWLALAVLRWLRWGWGCYATHGLWRAAPPKAPATPAPPPSAG